MRGVLLRHCRGRRILEDMHCYVSSDLGISLVDSASVDTILPLSSHYRVKILERWPHLSAGWKRARRDVAATRDMDGRKVSQYGPRAPQNISPNVASYKSYHADSSSRCMCQRLQDHPKQLATPQQTRQRGKTGIPLFRFTRPSSSAIGPRVHPLAVKRAAEEFHFITLVVDLVAARIAPFISNERFKIIFHLYTRCRGAIHRTSTVTALSGFGFKIHSAIARSSRRARRLPLGQVWVPGRVGGDGFARMAAMDIPPSSCPGLFPSDRFQCGSPRTPLLVGFLLHLNDVLTKAIRKTIRSKMSTLAFLDFMRPISGFSRPSCRRASFDPIDIGPLSSWPASIPLLHILPRMANDRQHPCQAREVRGWPDDKYGNLDPHSFTIRGSIARCYSTVYSSTSFVVQVHLCRESPLGHNRRTTEYFMKFGLWFVRAKAGERRRRQMGEKTAIWEEKALVGWVRLPLRMDAAVPNPIATSIRRCTRPSGCSAAPAGCDLGRMDAGLDASMDAAGAACLDRFPGHILRSPFPRCNAPPEDLDLGMGMHPERTMIELWHAVEHIPPAFLAVTNSSPFRAAFDLPPATLACFTATVAPASSRALFSTTRMARPSIRNAGPPFA
ncbi:hypothetical protein MSAN_01816800 [Mycena sanguinolenta]|uniref:Uncharacterized protein n=1 Tax=Mycena sanguinolenta TaxID=230812 RepID=A0A8H7CTE6_9AGAR|nr:hypothetical protein MSAN_01816800 [Mycena sanguinolenta]